MSWGWLKKIAKPAALWLLTLITGEVERWQQGNGPRPAQWKTNLLRRANKL